MIVKQISNLFTLMELFARLKKPLSVREIVDECGWPRSSVFNMVSTMMDDGYLYQPLARGGYYPTNKWMELARAFGDAQPMPPSVHELLVSLAKQTGETLFLATAEGGNIVFEDVVESSADIRFIANIGQRLPIHVTAAGRAILAQYTDKERATALQRIDYQRYEKDTFMTAAAVETAVAAGVQQGWHINMGVYAPGVAGIAVAFPFRGRKNAIALGGPSSRIEGNADATGKRLLEAVQRFLAQEQ